MIYTFNIIIDIYSNYFPKMCGIFGYCSYDELSSEFIVKLFESYMKIQPRGPDYSNFHKFNNNVLGFHRLSIMDQSKKGNQPFLLEDSGHIIYCVCNGEIYNYLQLIEEHKLTDLISTSDCEVLLPLYKKLGFYRMISELRGEFAIGILDIDLKEQTTNIYVGRDQTAIRPVFIGNDIKGFGFSSLLAGLVNIVDRTSIRQVKRAEVINVKISKHLPPSINSFIYHYLPDIDLKWNTTEQDRDLVSCTNNEIKLHINQRVLSEVRFKFIEAVKIRLTTDNIEIGALLSGGLDSSLVVSVASSHLKQFNKKLRTFSIGIPGSTDRKYAEIVALHCDTDHTHVEFTEQEMLEAIPKVISVIESYDITSVRASTCQYMISKWIRENTNIKVLLIGDYSDELTSGYLYFHNAPTPLSSHIENIRLLENICYFDVLRSDRCIAYNGLEARTPFGDHQFVDLYISINPEYRIPLRKIDSISSTNLEKFLLRLALDVDNPETGKPFLPAIILKRIKEALSDGVSGLDRSWFEIIQEHVSRQEIVQEMKFEDTYHIIPTSIEALYYRRIYNNLFGYQTASVIPFYWLPKFSGNITEPSARILPIYTV